MPIGSYLSKYDYDYHMLLVAQLPAQTFHSLIMAAMIRAGSAERQRLAWSFPDVAEDMRLRGHVEVPGPRAELGDQTRAGAMISPGGDVYDPMGTVEQLQEAMGYDTHYTWAPAVIALVRERHRPLWDAAVAAAQTEPRERT